MPDVPVATVLMDAFDNRLDGVDLVRPHHHQLLFAGDEHHVAADHLAEGALLENFSAKVSRWTILLLSWPRTGKRAGTAPRR